MDDTQRTNGIHESDERPTGRLYVSFSLLGRDLIPDEITQRLNIKPTHYFKYGDIKKNIGRQKIQVWNHGFWEITSDTEGHSSDDVTSHFEWLLGMLEPARGELMEILEDKKIKAQISCFWITPAGRINVDVEPVLLARLASLNVKIWFDIYCEH